MGPVLLVAAAVLIWVAVLAGTYLRIFEMRKWFVNPPVSLNRIHEQTRKSRFFWIPLSLLFILSILGAIIIYWRNESIRYYLIAAIICYACTGAVSSMFSLKEIIAATKERAQKTTSPQLHQRIALWMRWTTFRDILQFLAAIFVTIAVIQAFPGQNVY